MDDLLAGLTDALQSRICAALNQLNHRLRSKQIGWTECIREAYVACARELPRESAVALVVRYGRALGWLATNRQTSPPVTPAELSPLELMERYLAYPRRRSGRAEPGPVYEPIPEAEQQAPIAGIVADLISEWQPGAQAARPARGQRRSADHAADVPEIVAVLDRVARALGISLERWAREHHIARAVLFDWRGAGGKAVKGRVSPDKARDIEAAVHQDALRLRLIPTHTDSD